jgi:hypothetical protein
MPGDDIDHPNSADDAAESEIVGRWAFDAETGHELGGVIVLDLRHRLAGVDKDALADAHAVGADGGLGTVLDIFPSVNDGPRPRLANRYRPSNPVDGLAARMAMATLR